MTIDFDVPFFSNTPDNTHCFQAALKMLLKFYFPEKDYSFEELDEKTEKVKDLWTWPTAGLLWMQSLGIGVELVETFDYQQFVKTPEEYLLEFFGKEAGKEQIKNSDLPHEVGLIEKGLKHFNIENRIPKQHDIVAALEQNKLVCVNINSKVLSGKSGYVGHFVVIKGYYDEGVIIHDPGLPPIENRKIDWKTFERAWGYPNEQAKNLIVFGKI